MIDNFSLVAAVAIGCFFLGLFGLIELGRVFLSRPERPLLFVAERRSKSMPDVLTYVVSAAPPVDGDVVSRELTVFIDGVQQSTVAFDGSSVSLGTVSAPQDSEVMLMLVDIDDAGNRSQPAESVFVAADTLPPEIPGGLSVEVVSENYVPDEVPEVPPADESVPPEDAEDSNPEVQ